MKSYPVIVTCILLYVLFSIPAFANPSLYETDPIDEILSSDRLKTGADIQNHKILPGVMLLLLLSADCGAYVAPGVWKRFDCYNLAAIGKTTSDDPFTPSWRLIGGYWQWGRKGPDASQWHNTNTSTFAHGPTGPALADANSGSNNGWSRIIAPHSSWSDTVKTANDPCPAGFRVPTNSQWEGVVANNTQRIVGTWSTNPQNHTNYSAARFFGDKLMLPAAGYREDGTCSLNGRGLDGRYWSSNTQHSTANAWYLMLFGSEVHLWTINRNYGHSIRCIAE